MSTAQEWLAGEASGGRFVQLGGLGWPALEMTPAVLAAGAAAAWHVEAPPATAAGFAALRARAGAHAARLTCVTHDLHDGPALARLLPVADVVLVAQAFAMRDPLAVLHLAARHAGRVLAIESTVVPCDPHGLGRGAVVEAQCANPALLPAVRAALERRGVVLGQFDAPPDRHDARGMPLWDDMWRWFLTEGALLDMLDTLGWRVTARFETWGELGVLLAAQRVA